MFCSEDFWILKEKIMEYAEASHDLGYHEHEIEVTYPSFSSACARKLSGGNKVICYDLLFDIFHRLDQFQKEYTDLLYDLSDNVPDSDSYYGFDSVSDK